MDPFKLPQTTLVNLHSNFVPSPRLRGVSFPAPAHFAPTDNPTTFDQASLQNNTKIYQSEGRPTIYSHKPRTKAHVKHMKKTPQNPAPKSVIKNKKKEGMKKKC